jgi:hypothetical protein
MSNFYFCENCDSLFSPVTSATISLSPGLIEVRAIDYQTQYINIKKEEDTKEELVIKYLESYNKL